VYSALKCRLRTNEEKDFVKPN